MKKEKKKNLLENTDVPNGSEAKENKSRARITQQISSRPQITEHHPTEAAAKEQLITQGEFYYYAANPPKSFICSRSNFDDLSWKWFSRAKKKCLKNGAGMWTTGWMKRESNFRHSSNDCPHFNPLSLMAFFNHRKPF